MFILKYSSEWNKELFMNILRNCDKKVGLFLNWSLIVIVLKNVFLWRCLIQRALFFLEVQEGKISCWYTLFFVLKFYLKYPTCCKLIILKKEWMLCIFCLYSAYISILNLQLLCLTSAFQVGTIQCLSNICDLDKAY